MNETTEMSPQNFEEALAELSRTRSALYDALAAMDEVLVVMDYGADESLWPPGLSLAEAVARVVGLWRETASREVRVVVPPWTPEREAWLIELHGQGLTAKEIAEKMETSYHSVTSRVRKLGLRRHPRPKTTDPLTNEILCYFRENRGTLRDIARHFDMTYGALQRKLKRAGIDTRELVAQRFELDGEKVKRLYAEFKSHRKVADELGVPAGRVYRCLVDLGVYKKGKK